MADEQSRPPFNKPSPIPKNVDWQSLLRLDGDEMETHYRHFLESREFAAKSTAVIMREVCKRLGAKEKEITGKRIGHRDERSAAMEMLHRHGQLSQAAIGKVLGGLDYTTVSRERKRLGERAEQDKRLGAALREIDESLRLK